MRVLHVFGAPSTSGSGDDRRIEEIPGMGPTVRQLLVLIPDDEESERALAAAGVAVLVLGIRSGPVFFRWPCAILRLRRVIEEFRPDVVHTSLLAAQLAARLAGVSVVSTISPGAEPPWPQVVGAHAGPWSEAVVGRLACAASRLRRACGRPRGAEAADIDLRPRRTPPEGRLEDRLRLAAGLSLPGLEEGPVPERLFGVLVTFRRPAQLVEMLSGLAGQDRPLDELVVVDNAPTAAAAAVVAGHAERGHPAVYVAAPENLGPAGGIALGMEQVLQRAGDGDWIVLLDDDDPPDGPSALGEVAAFAASMVAEDPLTAGVGICGARFDWARGRQVRPRDDELDGPVPADSLGGGYLPMYQVAAVRRVGTFDAKLFFGFEELAYGVRLRRAGYHLYAHGPLWLRARVARGRTGITPRPDLALEEATWRRYYGLRNLVRILLDHGHPLAALRVSVERGLLKPLVNLPRQPALGLRHLHLNARACHDAWTGRMGRTVEPNLDAAKGLART